MATSKRIRRAGMGEARQGKLRLGVGSFDKYARLEAAARAAEWKGNFNAQHGPVKIIMQGGIVKDAGKN